MMNADISDILDKHVKSNIRSKDNYRREFSRKRIDRYLFVEGRTDESFVNKLQIENSNCIAMGGIIEAYKRLKGNYYEFIKIMEKRDVNGYDIDKIIDNIRQQSSKWSIIRTIDNNKDEGKCWYGLVDKDFDTKDDIKKYPEQIMVTDKHDLETSLLSTDKSIFETPKIISEAFEIALWTAYLIGKAEKYLLDNGYTYQKLQNDDHKLQEANYKSIIVEQDEKINLEEIWDITEIVNIENILNLLVTEQNGKSKTIIKSEVKRSGVLNIDLDYKPEDLYDTANGHDILNILYLLCKDQINKLIEGYNSNGDGHRVVEYAIINKYKISNFTGSNLYGDMIKKGLTPTTI